MLDPRSVAVARSEIGLSGTPKPGGRRQSTPAND